jgi:hypothetical protein
MNDFSLIFALELLRMADKCLKLILVWNEITHLWGESLQNLDDSAKIHFG